MADRSARTYRQLLTEALEIGRADGRFAAAFESPSTTTAHTATRCLGRTPAEFAGLLWGNCADAPPAGLELNAPLWYATGFAEGLAEAAVPPARTAVTVRVLS